MKVSGFAVRYEATFATLYTQYHCTQNPNTFRRLLATYDQFTPCSYDGAFNFTPNQISIETNQV